MLLLLSDTEVEALVSTGDAVRCLDGAFAEEAGRTRAPRTQVRWAAGMMNVMPAVIRGGAFFGLKNSYRVEGKGSSHVILYSAEEARPIAIMASNTLSRIRTGAAAGLATGRLARADADRLAVIGAGGQSFHQIAGVAAVRPLKSVSIWSRTRARSEALAAEAASLTDATVRVAPSAADCLDGAGIVTTITTAREPVIRRDWLARGAHVNAVGANALDRREIDAETILDADILVVDDLDQARLEAAEFVDLVKAGRLDWSAVNDLGALVTGRIGRGSPDQLTLFKSLGVGLQDIALAELVYRRAVDAGLGRYVEFV